MEVEAVSDIASLDVPTVVGFEGLSHGFGDDRDSMGAETGVGSVDAVMADNGADLGVARVVDAERGVKGVLVIGEFSFRPERMVGSSGVLPDRSRLKDICLVRRGAVEVMDGMTSGVSDFGERGCRAPEKVGCWTTLAWIPISSSGFSSTI